MKLLVKSLDWQMISFVAVTLVNEYMINVHFPKVYYWNGQREFQAKLKKIKLSKGKKNTKK